jgi:serine/threonine protein kinase
MTDKKDSPAGSRRYTILGAIHRGGMGEILLARAEGADGFSRKVVLKGLLPELIGDTLSHELFRREAQLMSRLEHPNIVRVIDFAYVDEKPYLAMEYVRGRNLHQVIQRAAARGERVPARVAAFVLAEALRGLHYAHRARDENGAPLGIIHRDVSPGNILVSFFGEVKVTDFGIAKAAGAKNVTGPRSVRGKARYVAPEIIRGDSASVASDIHSGGVVLAEALIGEPLWERRNVSETLMCIVGERRDETLARIFARAEDLPGLRAALRGSLTLEPSERFSSALQFAENLDAVCRAAGSPLTQAELGAYLRRLFHDAPDVPHEDSPIAGTGPMPAFLSSDVRTDPSISVSIRPDLHSIAVPVELVSDDEPSGEAPEDLLSAASPRALQHALLSPVPAQTHERTPAPRDTLPAPFTPDSDSASYFSELVELPGATDLEQAGVPGIRRPSIARRLRLWAKKPWVLITLGILIGAATALTGSLLALSSSR